MCMQEELEATVLVYIYVAVDVGFRPTLLRTETSSQMHAQAHVNGAPTVLLRIRPCDSPPTTTYNSK